jgi:riboflavin kinase / FMN adenylyltransferase
LPDGRRALTIGVFDGLHVGHRRVLGEVTRRARSLDLETCVLTFDPHPLAVVAPGNAPRLLTTIEHRIELLESVGIEVVAVVPFDDEVRTWNPSAFVDLVVEGLGAALVVVGEDFRFGRDRAGDVEVLRGLGAPRGLEVDVVPLVGGESPVSSTRIREMIADGDVVGAAGALDRHHEVRGVVVEGDGRGRTIGVPTANVSVSPEAALPGRGVYAVRAAVEPADWMPGVANIGVRPTFGGDAEVVEVHLLDRERDLYGETLRVRFIERIRDEQRFPDAEALVARIGLDMVEARRVLS